MDLTNIYNAEWREAGEEPDSFDTDAIDEPVRLELASHVLKCWREAKDAKQAVEQQMLKNLRQRRGEYESDKLAALHEQGLSDVFLKLTDAKCRGAESWIRDVLLPAGDRPWTMDATPIPDLPDELEALVQQRAEADLLSFEDTDKLRRSVMAELKEEADERAGAMETLCEDQQVEGGFRLALDQVIADVVTLKAGILKAPVFRREQSLSWSKDFRPIVDDKVIMRFERVSPFDIYPAPNAVSCQSAAYIIEHHHLQPSDIEALIGVDGYDDDAIDAALSECGGAGASSWLNTSDDVQYFRKSEAERMGVGVVTLSTEIDALQYHGQVRGQWLMDWGMDDDSLSENRWYEAEVWLIGHHVIKAALNEHPVGLRPYYHTGAIKTNDQFWHQSVPELMDDCQEIINASARNLINNMGMSSGPQIGLDHSRLPQGFDWQNIYPWKVWAFKADETGRSNSNPITFFQPDSNAAQLIGVMDKFKAWADELTGIPAYTQGIGQPGGAGGTASGLSMLMNAAAKGIRNIIYNVDIDIVEPVLYAQFVHNMLHHDDQSIKGDITIKPRGAAALIVKEQMQLRRGEFLAQTANPVDMQIIGIEGRAELLREAVRALDMPVDRIIPPRQELKEQMQQQQAAQQPQPPMQDPAQALMPDGSPAGGQSFNQF